jgi:hypothetical protein
MIPPFIRLSKRLVVLLLGLTIVYFAVTQIYPFFNNRTYATIALFATYVATAYVLIPAIIRVIRIFIVPKHIPLYSITPDGFASDPINVGIIGSKQGIEKAMQKAGWYPADKRTLRNLLRLAKSMLTRKPYLTAPFSTLYLFGRKQDLSFQKPYTDDPSHRHHVRFWACHTDGPEAFHHDVRFWQRFHKRQKDNSGRQLWVGAASRDVGIMPIRHNAQLTHMIDSDTDSERDLIVHDLRASHCVAKTFTEKVGEAYRLKNRVLGGSLHSDGRIRICILKS